MGTRQQRITDHSVREHVKQLIKTTEEFDYRAATTDPEQIEAYQRLQTVAQYAQSVLNNIDPALVTEGLLGELQNRVQELINREDQFRSNLQPNPLHAQLDQVVEQLGRIQLAVHSPDSKIVVQTRDDIMRDIDRSYSKMAERLQTEGEKFEKRAEQSKQTLASLEEEFTRLRKDVGQTKDQSTQALSDLQTQFTDADAKRSKEHRDKLQSIDNDFKEKTRKHESKIDDVLNTANGKIEGLIEQIETTSSACLNGLDEKLERATKIVGLIANTGMAGHYQKVADGDEWNANLFRWAAIVFFAAAVVAAFIVIFKVDTTTFQWGPTLFRLLLASIILAPAFYCARESAQHRRAAARNRRLELEFASLNPYLETLPEDKVNEIKQTLAQRYFASAGADAATGEELLGQKNLRGDQLLTLFKEFASIVQKLAGK